MRTLTIERLRENPWNVMTCRMPKKPRLFLLSMALHAAEYCEFVDIALDNAVRKGIIKAEVAIRARKPDGIRRNYADWASRAEKKFTKVYNLYAELSDRRFYEAIQKSVLK